MKNITLTGGTGALAHLVSEMGGFPQTHLNDNWAIVNGLNPLEEDTWAQFWNEMEFCGFAGSASLSAICKRDSICLVFSCTFMLFGDCTTFIDQWCASNCAEYCVDNPNIGSVTIETIVCDEDGFVSCDFTITTTQGTLSGTIHR